MNSDPDWSVHLLQLSARGELGRANPRLLLDLPALAQPWTCASHACTPGRRAPDARSCCADLEVTPSPEERAAIEAALPDLASSAFVGDALARPGRRCVFSVDTPDGLRCQLHALNLKPLPCRLFPLVLVDIEDGRTLLTAIHRKTARLAGSRPARAFPCLGWEGAPTVAESCADTIADLFGAKAAKATIRAVTAWATPPSSPPR